MLIKAVFLLFWPLGHPELRSEVDSLSSNEHLVSFKPGTFDFNFNALTH